jgi:hypothetical protein
MARLLRLQLRELADESPRISDPCILAVLLVLGGCGG